MIKTTNLFKTYFKDVFFMLFYDYSLKIGVAEQLPLLDEVFIIFQFPNYKYFLNSFLIRGHFVQKRHHELLNELD